MSKIQPDMRCVGCCLATWGCTTCDRRPPQAAVGWRCPKCGRGNAPSTSTCSCGPDDLNEAMPNVDGHQPLKLKDGCRIDPNGIVVDEIGNKVLTPGTPVYWDNALWRYVTREET